MSLEDDDGEIEYLEEDEDLIYQYVQSTQAESTLPVIQSVGSLSDQVVESAPVLHSLLVERTPKKRKITIKTEDDSDYDPHQDLKPQKKKTKTTTKKYADREIAPAKTVPQHSANLTRLQNITPRTYVNKLKQLPNITVKRTQKESKSSATKETPSKKFDSVSLLMRKKMDIRMSDFQDALCLPVKAITNNDYEYKKLRQWNDLCIETYKKNEKFSKGDTGNIISSTRNIVFRNAKNKFGKIETTIYGKTVTENKKKQKKEDVFQSILPKYRERRVLPTYTLRSKLHKSMKHTYEVILAQEQQKDEDILVVYKPKDAAAAVYKLIEKNEEDEQPNDDDDEPEPIEMKEVTCCRVCAPCYQTSWRGVRKKTGDDSIKCSICKRSFISVYNLLSHLKSSHVPADVQKYRAHLSRTLATIIDYHYKCRICQEQFISIKSLRKHVLKHQGIGVFRCEVGNHMAS